jgi:catechol 2,3-dioxygenase-like lactoylglutathione lyase family enzyme
MLANATLQPMLATARADAARAFYRDTLGLTLNSDDIFALVFAVGDGEVRIAKAPAVTPSLYAVMGFIVDDIAAIVARLTEKGVAFERYGFLVQDAAGIWTAPSGTQVAWFRDPDGNLLSLSQG